MNFAANLFDAHSIVGDLGLIGILAIIFAETGLLVGLAFPGDSLLFIAGVAASGSGAAILGAASLNPVVLFIGAPIGLVPLMGESCLTALMDASSLNQRLLQLRSGSISMEQVKHLF
jgi:membrane protein DedA with SNARE-associated domain